LTGKGSGKRGRPLGFRLSEASKRAISVSKMGQRHRPETKDRISKSLLMYFRKKNPLSEEITNRYCRCGDDELCDWVTEHQDELDSSMDILTEKALSNKTKIEITCGPSIEFFSHSLTPEYVVMLKDLYEKNGELTEEDLGGLIHGR
jgi:hypothetical protein